MKFELMVANLLNWFRFVLLQQTGPTQCVIVQDKMSISRPPIPSFMLKNNKTGCQVHDSGEGMVRCGKSGVYIRPECVCTFHNVYEATHHGYSSCPDGEESDVVTHLNCQDCKMYSLNNNGPCINGGKLTCRGNEVAPDITCECPPHYKGMFCEEKMENVTRLCDRILISSADNFRSCAETKHDCVTFSRNRQYAFKCNETEISQEGRGLQLCSNTEDITVAPAVTGDPYSIVPEDSTTDKAKSHYVISAAEEMRSSIPVLTMILLTLQL